MLVYEKNGIGSSLIINNCIKVVRIILINQSFSFIQKDIFKRSKLWLVLRFYSSSEFFWDKGVVL